MRAFVAQTRAELRLTLGQSESLLLTIGIPVLLLVFFSLVDVLPTGTEEPVDFLAPGVLALAVMSTAMVSLAIATGFQRQYRVLKRLRTTPLGRPRLLAAKTAAIGAVEVVQVVVLVPIAVALGWRPAAAVTTIMSVGLAVLLATTAFAGLALLMAGTLRAEVTLAAANALYLVFLLLGGMIIPLGELPTAVRVVAEILPASALSDALHEGLAPGGGVPGRAWAVLAGWAAASPAAAAALFRFE